MVVIYIVTLWFLAGWVFTCAIMCTVPESFFWELLRDIWDKRDHVPGRIGFVILFLALWPWFAWAVWSDYREGNLNYYD